MTRPKLQLALDNQDLDSALHAIEQCHEHIDIIEVGTILCLAEGMAAVRTMRALYPEHIILADVRIIKAGGVIAKLCFDAGASWVTVMSDATQETLKAVVDVAKTYGGDVQIELNDGWTYEQAALWRESGVRQVVVHRSSEVVEAEEHWTEATFETVRKLKKLGFDVTVTGGISAEEIVAFSGVPISIFIAGRAIRNAPNPAQVAISFQEAIARAYE